MSTQKGVPFMKNTHRQPRRARLVLLALALHLLTACMSQETLTLLEPTRTPEPTASPVAAATFTSADVDFSVCTEPMEILPFMPISTDPLRIVRHSLSDFPSTAPVEMAYALRDLGGVILVGTDANGRQFLAGLDTETWTCKVLHTLEEGMRVTSIGQVEVQGRYDETGAFAWTETDGDAWRLRLYDERLQQGEEAGLLTETTLAAGALSQGSAFLPMLRSSSWYCARQVDAIYATPEGAVRLDLNQDKTSVISQFSPICLENTPVWSPNTGEIFAIVEQDGQTALRVWTEEQATGEMREAMTLTLRLPEGESVVKIIRPYWGYNGYAYRFCLLTDAGNLYWHRWDRVADQDATTEVRFVARDVAVVEECSHAEAQLLSQKGDSLLSFYNDQEAVTLFRLSEKPVELTAITSAYMDERVTAPHEIFVFGKEEGAPVVFVVEQEDDIRLDCYGE